MDKKVTKKMLEDYAAQYPYCMFVIYADWCGHCQNMKQKLGKYFDINYDVILFLEEADVSKELKDYFPHIRVYENGKERDGNVEELYQLIDNFKKSVK